MSLLAVFAFAASAEPPTVAWEYDYQPYQLHDGIALDFAFAYEVHLVGGSDPQGDATLTLRVCENGRCSDSDLGPPAEGRRLVRYGVDPSQYHVGKNLFTLTLLLVDDGQRAWDRLVMPIVVLP